jgi:hypothetical protein
MSTVALDFDGVLSEYTGWKGHSAPLDPPVEGAIQAIRDYQDAGLSVVIYTSRADSPVSAMRLDQWLRTHGLEHKRVDAVEITNKKPPAIVYLDDRAICFTGKFPSPKEIIAFKTWQQY